MKTGETNIHINKRERKNERKPWWKEYLSPSEVAFTTIDVQSAVHYSDVQMHFQL